LNKCYEICNARQTSKHLLLNCRHYRAEQRKLKEKVQFKNTNTRVFEKYSNCDEKMTIRNKRVECKESEEMKKNESTMTRV